jgi:heme exporter protein A
MSETSEGERPGVTGGADLTAENLACRRGGRLVFAGLSCTLQPGGILLLTGTNGSGKSSLLRLLATLIAPAEGRLLYGGAPIADMPQYRASLHYVGHLNAIKPALSPREMLQFWAALSGVAIPDVAAALETFGLGAVTDWPCRWLSAGQRRRLALARLVAVPAPIWLLDEPTAALDSDGEECLLAAIAAHCEAGGRAAIATHQPLALADADSIVLDDFAATPDDASAAFW